MLKESRKETYTEKLNKVISNIEKSGFNDIRADHDDYEKPAGLINQQSNHTYTPDATAKNRLGQKHYFEISRKVSDTTKLINKWKVLDTLARIKEGAFKIFVPHGTMRFTQDIVNRHNIQAELVKL